MHNTSLTFLFRDLPKFIIGVETARNRFQENVKKDIQSELELEYVPKISWNIDVTGKDLLLNIEIAKEDARFLQVALHNLHSAILINA